MFPTHIGSLVPIPFLLVDSTDHITGLTGQSGNITLTIQRPGLTSFSASSGSIGEIGSGWYNYTPVAADVVAGSGKIHWTCSGADPGDDSYVCTPSLIFNSGTASAGGGSTITLDATPDFGSTSATDDLYNGMMISIEAGTGAGQSRIISDYVGSTRVATVGVAWTTTPDNTSLYCLWKGFNPSLDSAGRIDLKSTGLDAISATQPTGPATTFRQMVIQTWMRFFNASKLDTNTNTIVCYATNGSTVVTTQAVADSGGIQTQGVAS